jgi:HD-like signal output (HDOD) protein
VTSLTPATLAAELQKLPLHNETALRVIALLDDPDVEVTDLGRLIQTDPGLTTRALKLANSTFFGRRNEVTAIDKAIVAVGFSTVRTFALAAAFDLFSDKGVSLPRNFWHHAIASAAGTTVLARRLRVSAGDAFSAGLIHDLGVALLHRYDSATYEAHCMAPDLPEEELIGLERSLFGIDHAAAAAMTLAEVRFPKLLVDAVALHHEPVRRRWRSRPDLSAVVSIGQLLGGLISPNGSVAKDDRIDVWLGALGMNVPVRTIVAELVTTYTEVTGYIAI